MKLPRSGDLPPRIVSARPRPVEPATPQDDPAETGPGHDGLHVRCRGGHRGRTHGCRLVENRCAAVRDQMGNALLHVAMDAGRFARGNEVGRALSPDAVVDRPVRCPTRARYRRREVQRRLAPAKGAIERYRVEDIAEHRAHAKPLESSNLLVAADDGTNVVAAFNQSWNNLPPENAGCPEHRDRRPFHACTWVAA